MTAVSEKRLRDCIDGMTGVISRVDGKTLLSARLRELGVVPGEWVRILRKGNPTLLQVGESRFCVQSDQLDGISLVPIEG